MGVPVTLRCYAELNDHLPPERRQRAFEVRVEPPLTLGDLIEGLGLPSEEVDMALVDGVSRGLDHPLAGGERVALYPVFESFDVAALARLRGEPLRAVRFVADAHLGRLARYLRLLGFDTRFENDPGDRALARLSAEEGRILLSRDRGLLARAIVTHGLWVPPVRPREQLAWVVERLDLRRLIRPFTRCTVCNGKLEPVAGPEVRGQVPERVAEAFDRFWRCRGCGRIYWEGSHYQRLRALVEQVAVPPQGR
jgi:uncharacterized protein with PIN domain